MKKYFTPASSALWGLVFVGMTLAIPLIGSSRHFHLSDSVDSLLHSIVWIFIIISSLLALFGLRSNKLRFKLYSAGTLLLWIWLALQPTHAPRESVPPGVRIEGGLTRYEAEFLYAGIHKSLRGLYWQGFAGDGLRESWRYLRDWRYTIQSLKLNPDGSVSAMVESRWRGTKAAIRDHRITGTWPGKSQKSKLPIERAPTPPD
ncbi:MAG: hypothetical protein H7X97_13195 [Opitutaceae bacterium]|nr:hypothetical protein [Verrucomicrobiales bacterium]